jgi:hypothetical protein
MPYMRLSGRLVAISTVALEVLNKRKWGAREDGDYILLTKYQSTSNFIP